MQKWLTIRVGKTAPGTIHLAAEDDLHYSRCRPRFPLKQTWHVGDHTNRAGPFVHALFPFIDCMKCKYLIIEAVGVAQTLARTGGS